MGLRRVILALSLAGAVGTLVTAAVQTASKPDMVSRKARARGAADDSNVKVDTGVNTRAKPSPGEPAPPPLPPTPPRPSCAITFDNDTNLFTKTYIDGHYAGTILPFGELTATAPSGAAVLYARAEYDDGTADAWGPVRASCQTKYLWRLAD